MSIQNFICQTVQLEKSSEIQIEFSTFPHVLDPKRYISMVFCHDL